MSMQQGFRVALGVWMAFAVVASAHALQAEATALSEGTSTPGGKRVVFSAPFSDLANWSTRSTAFPIDTTHGHPSDNKLDRLSEKSRPEDGAFYAINRGPAWETKMVTTENSPNGFMLRTGDRLNARITLFAPQGAWPAIWTWNKDLPGLGEIDLFEYHATNPKMLEYRNHVSGGFSWDDHVVEPGKPFDLQVDFNPDGVVRRVDGRVITESRQPLPQDWSAYLIVNLSIANGGHEAHKAPAADQPAMVGMVVHHLFVSR